MDVVLVCACILHGGVSQGGDIDEAREFFRAGRYAECAKAAARAIDAGAEDEAWRSLKMGSELALGEYSRALATLGEALERHPGSIRLRWLGVEVYRYNDDPGQAEAMLQSIDNLARRTPWRYADPADRVTLGRVFLRRGADPRDVLELIYDRVKEDHPDYAETHVASGELALEKHDYGLAAEAFERALMLAPDDPDTHWRLAQARAPGDPALAEASLEEALRRNPHHVGSLLLRTDKLIDSEEYARAAAVADRILEVNSRHPKAWAYRAVLAHLEGDSEAETTCRRMALGSWTANPEVDHLIGLKLSQKYRFAEGAAHQRRALGFDPDHLPAKLQLCQDLLRLGEEEEGWRLAEEVHEKDQYNVVAYNLSLLREHLGGFRTVDDDGLIVRMDPHEAEIYGHRVLQLLRRARKELRAKYEVRLDEPIVVEIFPEQKDFAIRTFGLPGGAGFLGVCFGRVITANSPASQGKNPSNWQAVLWHEFCHVVTLHKTRNKMPRWLSEGISVYEERQANPAWGQTMTPRYREMVLGGELTPVSRLSAAFLAPSDPLRLQFAYYESSLVVEYLIERHGLAALKGILSQLADGVSINEALTRSTGSLEDLDQEFARFARSRAEALGPKADWERFELPASWDAAALADWNREHADNFWGLKRLGLGLLEEGRWEEAKKPLRRLAELCPECAGEDSAYALLAAAHRELKQTSEERAALEKLAALAGDALGAFLRLMELCSSAGDWRGVARNAERSLAVNPLLAAPHRHMARAAEELGRPGQAIRSHRSLLLMHPADPAGTHYRLARLLEESGDLASARREVLKAIEEAPRFRDAHRLFLNIVRRMEAEAERAVSLEPASAKTP